MLTNKQTNRCQCLIIILLCSTFACGFLNIYFICFSVCVSKSMLLKSQQISIDCMNTQLLLFAIFKRENHRNMKSTTHHIRTYIIKIDNIVYWFIKNKINFDCLNWNIINRNEFNLIIIWFKSIEISFSNEAILKTWNYRIYELRNSDNFELWPPQIEY